MPTRGIRDDRVRLNQGLGESDRFVDFEPPGAVALLHRLIDDPGELVSTDGSLFPLRALAEERTKPGHAELGELIDHPIEAVALGQGGPDLKLGTDGFGEADFT